MYCIVGKFCEGEILTFCDLTQFAKIYLQNPYK